MTLEQTIKSLNSNIKNNGSKSITGSVLNSEMLNTIKLMFSSKQYVFGVAEIGDALFNIDGAYIPLNAAMLSDGFPGAALANFIGFVASNSQSNNGDGRLKVFSPHFMSLTDPDNGSLSEVLMPWNCYGTNIIQEISDGGYNYADVPCVDQYNGWQNCQEVYNYLSGDNPENSDWDKFEEGSGALTAGSTSTSQTAGSNRYTPAIISCWRYQFNGHIARGNWYLGAYQELRQICSPAKFTRINQIITAFNQKFGTNYPLMKAYKSLGSNKYEGFLWTSSLYSNESYRSTDAISVRPDNGSIGNDRRYGSCGVRALAAV